MPVSLLVIIVTAAAVVVVKALAFTAMALSDAVLAIDALDNIDHTLPDVGINVLANAMTGTVVGILNGVGVSETAVVLAVLIFPVPTLCSVCVLRKVAVDASADVSIGVAVDIAADTPLTPAKSSVMAALLEALRWCAAFDCSPVTTFNRRSRRLPAGNCLSWGCCMMHASMQRLSSSLDCGEKTFWGLLDVMAYAS